MADSIRFGCIADDFTGASDAASFLQQGGAATLLLNGTPAPQDPLPAAADAVVLALKTRSIDAKDAVDQSTAGLRWLQSAGAQQFYVKYCSTFDSTPAGNIGPVCDALMEALDVPYTVLCPSLPVNGRTVKDGMLYVNGVPLAETHMRRHPLNPMWSSNIPTLMQEQSRYACLVLSRATMQSAKAVQGALAAFGKDKAHFYVVPDYETDTDADAILQHFGHLPLLTGGSGLMTALGRRHARGAAAAFAAQPPCEKALVLAGSCSEATKEQVQYFLQHGGQGIMLQPAALADGTQTADSLWHRAQAALPQGNVLLYTAGSGGQDVDGQDGGEDAARLLEDTLAALAQKAVQSGISRIITAGGETSGAVTKALGYSAYSIGQSVAPGVPVMTPLVAPAVRLVLKSGNFGQPDFFARALDMTQA